MNPCLIILHILGDENDDENEGFKMEARSLSDSQLETVVDQVLDYDENGDGYISYGEFRNAQIAQAHAEERRSTKCTTCGD